jgi:3'5'-cyclic nucleotide phosphodiesterase
MMQKNAETPLSVVFDGKSALEQMHCQLLLRVMRCHGLERLIDSPDNGQRIRRLLWETVVATDMSVHGRFMEEFGQTISGEIDSLTRRQTIICQTILKCADISNPVRTMDYKGGNITHKCTI